LIFGLFVAPAGWQVKTVKCAQSGRIVLCDRLTANIPPLQEGTPPTLYVMTAK
jgi:hypothetical protein